MNIERRGGYGRANLCQPIENEETLHGLGPQKIVRIVIFHNNILYLILLVHATVNKEMIEKKRRERKRKREREKENLAGASICIEESNFRSQASCHLAIHFIARVHEFNG